MMSASRGGTGAVGVTEDVKFGYGDVPQERCDWTLQVGDEEWGCVMDRGHWFWNKHKMSPNPPRRDRGCNAYVEFRKQRHYCQRQMGSYAHFPNRGSVRYIHSAGGYEWEDKRLFG